MDRRLSDYVTFVSGVNPTRANKQIDDVIVYYEQSDFNNDFLILCRVGQFKNAFSIGDSPFNESRIGEGNKNDIGSTYWFLVSAYKGAFERRLCKDTGGCC